MIVTSRHLGLALTGAALLISHAQATFDFPSCVDGCIVSSGCQPDSAKCMCKKAADGLLLDSVVSCLWFSCKSDLRTFEASFLDPIEQGCDDSDRDIPSSKLKAAESLASSYIAKLPATTTANNSPTSQATSAPPKTTAKANPTTTSKQAASSSSAATTTEEEESTSTSASDRGIEQSTTSSAGETTATPTQVTVSTTVTRNTAASSASPGSGSDSGFDTNPFGGSSSAASAIQPLLSLVGLPLAIGLLALR